MFGVGYDKIGANGITFDSALARGTNEDDVVKISANGTVAVCSAADQFHGVARVIEGDGHCTVQTKGIVTILYTGTAPTIGYFTLEADGSGNVQIVATPALGDKFYHVINVDTTNTLVTFDLG
jgi:hypothetical protein